MTLRDKQRNAVYYAEDQAMKQYGWNFNIDSLTFNELEYICHTILNSNVIKGIINKYEFITSHNPNEFKIVDPDRRYKYAQTTVDTMIFPKNTRNMSTICHELAHILVRTDEDKYEFHGKEFCFTYLLLVKYFMGESAHTFLLSSFITYNIDCYI